ncbi:hypothetical protein PHLGIDRAFT_12989 [Phlebiopsis gigantea 11061_1 CR5-6]|uniref:Cytochrome P450 n=1 Tax=Phlebiopsis gigantea (strain 11061_1 CR5-6) TaxID=745531 RepID=A0A0C3RZK4_PHLG1|nr:hypothetical protein PHLGIDRAFT_12989 [Phlebiopsis gigantea 11061_1 CR5-6]
MYVHIRVGSVKANLQQAAFGDIYWRDVEACNVLMATVFHDDNPSRFLRSNEVGRIVLDPDVPGPETAVFGFGRRVCPPRYASYESLWIAVARTLANLDISPLRDANGSVKYPKVEYTDGFVSCLTVLLSTTISCVKGAGPDRNHDRTHDVEYLAPIIDMLLFDDNVHPEPRFNFNNRKWRIG